MAGLLEGTFLRTTNAEPFPQTLRGTKDLPPRGLLLRIEELKRTENAPEEEARSEESGKSCLVL